MKQPKYIYLDLDRTLIDTPALVGALFAQCEAQYGVPQQTLQDTMDDFRPLRSDMRYYDFFAHLERYGVDPQAAQEDLLAALADQDFVYPDAHDMLQWLTEQPYKLYVLSFGKHDFQQFKYRLAPQLHHMPFISILYDKGRYLSEVAVGPKLLVDDRMVTALPADSHQLVIDRMAKAEIAAHDAQHTIVRSLTSVATILAK